MANVYEQIEALARSEMTVRGLAHWRFQWDRSKHRMGCCNHEKRTISLSRFLVLRTTADTIHNTILHEIAHALVGPGHGHNSTWKRQALALGCNGERCYRTDAVAPIAGRYQATCPSCGKVFHKHRNPGTRERWCLKCGRVAGQIYFRRTS